MDGAKDVPILGGHYPVRAQIRSLDSFSGHADHSELLRYFRNTQGKKSSVFLVHGEPECAMALQNALENGETGGVHIAQKDEIVSC